MVRKVITTLVDDINGVHIKLGQGETVTFALNGVNYKIDLNDENAAKLRPALEEYTEKGRRVGRSTAGKATPRRSSSSVAKEDL
jgi:hypothetical protein